MLTISEPANTNGPILGAEDHPLTGDFSRAYYPAVNGDRYQDRSFSILRDGRDVAFVPVTTGPAGLDYYGMPIRIFASESGPDVVRLAVEHAVTMAHGQQIRILDFDSEDQTSPISAACASAGLHPQELLKSVADLSLTPEDRRHALRRRFRTHANWGKANISMQYVNILNPDRSAFEAFQDFHFRVAGRVTRPQQSWEILFQTVLAGTGEVSIGRIGDDIVTALMVVDGKSWSYYATGVNDRERFDKPMAHWPMVDAIERSAARGKKFFEIGDVHKPGFATDKEVAIGQFKAGFATRLLPCIVWRTEQ